MIKAISPFAFRPRDKDSKGYTRDKTCDNCFEEYPLCYMSNGTLCCIACAKDIEELTNRKPQTEG